MQSGPSTFTGVRSLACDRDSRLTLEQYDAQIRWTSYGIPHVKADDWGSLVWFCLCYR